MSEAKFTPGPWELETVRTQVGVCHKIGKLGSSTRITSACLYDDCYSDKPGDLQLLADAHLIAAAPDMYEALKAAREKALASIPSAIGFTQGDLQAIANICNVALKKASGQ